MPEEYPPRRRLRMALLVSAAVLLVPVAAGAALLATFDAEHYKPQIEAAIKRATGRDITLNGAVRVALNPRLVFEASNAALGNFENGTRPDMLTLQRVEAEVALWPLLHGQIEITRLVLVRPDILLETDADGNPNWIFRRHPGGEAPAVANAVAKRVHEGHLDIQSVRVSNGTLTWHDGTSGITRVVELKQFEVREPAEDAPIDVSGQVRYAGADIKLAGHFGSLARLREPDATTPWPVQLALAAEGAELNASGSFTDPLHAGGYDLKLDGRLADLAALTPWLPGIALPPLLDVAFAVQVKDVGAAWPEPSAVVVHAGASDLGSVVPELKLSKLDISAPRFDEPVQIDVQGSYADTPLKLEASLGAPAALLPGLSSSPFPVDISAEAAGASFYAKGGVATPSQTSGLDVKLTARIPDLAALSPLVHRDLPRLNNIAFDGELVDRNASYLQGVMLKGIRLALPEADLTGDAVLGLTGQRPLFHATLSATRIDADALWAAFQAGSTAEKSATAAAPPAAEAAPEPAQPAEPGSPPPAPAPQSVRPGGQPAVFSEAKLPVDRLRGEDMELRMTVGLLRSGATDYRNVIAHFRLANGHIHVGPLEGQMPQGPFDIYFDFNPNQPQWPVSFTAHAPGLPLKPLMALLQLPDDDSGALEIDADLKSAGDNPHAIAAGLNGHLGLAMMNGTVDNRLLGYSLDKFMHNAHLPAPIGANGGHSDVRCFAMRADATRGAVALRAFVLDMTHVHLSSEGTINLGDETLALRTRPMLKLAGNSVVVPVRIDGPIAAPHAETDQAAAAAAVSMVPKLAAPLLGALPGGQPAGADQTNCDAALAMVHGGGTAAAAAPVAPPSASPPPPPPRPERKLSGRELMRRLLR